MVHVHLGKIGNLGKQLKVMSAKSPKKMKEALRRSARFGVTAIQMKIGSMGKAPVDTGQYRRSFSVKDTEDGAIVFSAERYAVIIEAGRKPGSKPPPQKEIAEWLSRKLKVAKKRRTKKAAAKARKPKKFGPKEGPKYGPKKPPKRKFGPKKTKRSREEKFGIIVRAIQMSIHKKGIAPRRVVAKSLPMMQRDLKEQLKRSMREIGKVG